MGEPKILLRRNGYGVIISKILYVKPAQRTFIQVSTDYGLRRTLRTLLRTDSKPQNMLIRHNGKNDLLSLA